MPLHSLAPGYAKIHYGIVISSIVLDHVITLPMDLYLVDGGASRVHSADGNDLSWDDAVAGYITPFLGVLSAAATAFVLADLYSQENANSAPVWQASVSLDSFIAVNGGAAISAQQDVLTFRSADGGIIRVTWLEDTQTANFHRAYADLGTGVKTFVDYMLSASSVYYARDNSFPTAFLFQTTKINDKLRKIRFGL